MEFVHQAHVDEFHRDMETQHRMNMHEIHRSWHNKNPDPRSEMDRIRQAGKTDPDFGVNLGFGSNFLIMHHHMVLAGSLNILIMRCTILA